MKRDDVKIGSVYAVKVSGTVQPVRITGERPERVGTRGCRDSGCHAVHDGWYGKNMLTGREVRIKSATRLRYEMVLTNGRWCRVFYVKSEPV